MNIVAACQYIILAGRKPTLPEVRPIVDAWYARPGNGAGGELHVELDDGNLDHSYLVAKAACEQYSDEARLICVVLSMLSPSQRRRL